MTNVADDRCGLVLDWAAFHIAAGTISTSALEDGRPDIVVGILRGGMIPAVTIAHGCGVRTVRAVEVMRTLHDGVDAAKVAAPVIRNPGSLGDLRGADVLVVDDVAGSGESLAVGRDLAMAAGATRVRTAVAVVNAVNWCRANAEDPGDILTYVGLVCRGWVEFPWERQ